MAAARVVALGLLAGFATAWQWVGVYELEHDAEYVLTLSKVDGSYAESSMMIYVVELGDSDDFYTALDTAENTADYIMDDFCTTTIAAGGTFEAPNCATFTMGAGADSTWSVEIHDDDHRRGRRLEGDHAYFAVFTEHELQEFDGSLTDEDGDAVDAVCVMYNDEVDHSGHDHGRRRLEEECAASLSAASSTAPLSVAAAVVAAAAAAF